MVLNEYVQFTNVTISSNSINYTEGGVVSLNPRSTSEEKMPIFHDCIFNNNVNSDKIGGGVLSLYESFSYREYPMALTISYC